MKKNKKKKLKKIKKIIRCNQKALAILLKDLPPEMWNKVI